MVASEVVNPHRMREDCSNHCVCVSVCLVGNCYIPRVFFVEIQVSLGFLCCFQRKYCVDLVENALFKSSGDIC